MTGKNINVVNVVSPIELKRDNGYISTLLYFKRRIEMKDLMEKLLIVVVAIAALKKISQMITTGISLILLVIFFIAILIYLGS